jgi:hypothetical protein
MQRARRRTCSVMPRQCSLDIHHDQIEVGPAYRRGGLVTSSKAIRANPSYRPAVTLLELTSWIERLRGKHA